ncbi:DNA topoisomerase 2-alpha-like isoform X2 [Anneissia japonica]|uniref:DNA topoisomerase 2-alpha-like isoform X2 n=1 Tax=Anneissia japonica TaxID=1529436 RepID=UPI0014254B0C|nr:DNA topoisomerase 2-alpha-like isoform X2 [Anneissia japonica]
MTSNSESEKGLKWVTIFDNDDDDATAEGAQPKPQKKGNKRLSVERIYQKKTQLEHILLRPDSYIGSTEPVKQQMWVHDGEEGMVNREVTFVPGLYKIFDEILVNAADNKQRDPTMDCIKITIDPENNSISVWNNGKGIPIVEHQTEKVFVPELIFGHLLTSSNYNDDERKVTGGRNGYGAKLCNIFSQKFKVVTACKEYKKKFSQTWTNNMGKAGEHKIVPFDGKDFTEVTFRPDLPRFHMESLDPDTVALLTRRAYDIAGATKGVKVYLNGKRLPLNGFKSYVDMYVGKRFDDDGNPLKVVHEVVNPRWEVCICMSEKGFQQVSFVNSIATTKGGRHTDYVTDQIVTKLIQAVKKKNKSGINVKPFQIKNHLWVFVNCLIENPAFDSQTKENMTLQTKKFGSTCALSEKFFKQAMNCGVVESVMSWMRFKAQSQLDKKCTSKKHTKLKGIPKLDDANDAGGRHSLDCTLILTEGDSAKSLAVSGLGVVGRDRYGVFPLRGKVLNVREASHKQIMENAEINNIIKILGLQYKNKYTEEDTLKSLRYGKVMIMTDQDQDGSHIKGLLINFIQTNWPHLLRYRFVEEFITPIVKATKANDKKSFFSLPEFEQWKSETENWKTYKIKYYKGLGTSTMKEAKEYFSDMVNHRIPFRYAGPEDDAAIELAFSKKKIDERKEWLTEWLHERRRRREDGLPDLYLYNKDTRFITYNDFINKELVLFSNADNERSIPSMVDGLKPGQRKVLFATMKKYEKREVKVAQMAGSVAEISAYHHGEMSLMSTIINMAQNHVGSNNLNLLLPIGQFGTRLHGGKDAASPRYIFTQLSPLARHVFNVNDDALLKSQFDDNLKIEPEWYCPIIPMVLVNGSEGIGTGWSTKIPNFDIREIIANLKRLIDGEEPLPMLPSYKGFVGTIEELETNRYVVSGEVSIIDNNTIEITELPIRSWTQNYKENVLEPMLYGTDKQPAVIQDYKEYHTDTTVRFLIKLSEAKLAEMEHIGLHKAFKIQSTIMTQNMVLFDEFGCIKRFDSVLDILREFYDLRLRMYVKRKIHMERLLEAESNKLNNQARFILEKIEGKLVIENKTKRDMISLLLRNGYESDPVKALKETMENAADTDEDDMGEDTESTVSAASSGSGPDYNYLLGMAMWNLTKEKKDDLLKNRDTKAKELGDLRRKTPKSLWRDDLKAFMEELETVEKKEKDDMVEGDKIASKAAAKANKRGQAKLKTKITLAETKPSPMGRRVVPRIDDAMKNKAPSRKRKPKDENVQKKLFVKEEVNDEVTEEGEVLSLADRLAAKDKSSAGANKMKQSKLSFQPAKAKKPKMDSWLDDSDDEKKSDNSSSDKLDAFDLMKAASQKEAGTKKKPAATKKTTTKKTTKKESSASDEGKPAKKPVKQKKALTIDSDSDISPVKKPVKKPAAKKATKPKKKKMAWSSDDDDNSDLSFDAGNNDTDSPVVQSRVGGRARAAVKYTYDDDSDPDSDF